MLGVEFSVPVLLSAGASLPGLDRLFDDGWLADAGPNRARFLQPAQVQEVVAAIPWYDAVFSVQSLEGGSGTRSWHAHLRRCVARRATLRTIIWRHTSLRQLDLCSFAQLKGLANNGGFDRR